MTGKRCDFSSQSTFNGEIAIHFSGIESLNNSVVWVFPKPVVGLHGGFAELTVPTVICRFLLRRRLERRPIHDSQGFEVPCPPGNETKRPPELAPEGQGALPICANQCMMSSSWVLV